MTALETPLSRSEERVETGYGGLIGGIVVLLILGAAARFLDANVASWFAGTALAGPAKAIEFPVYAIALGLLGNLALAMLGLRERFRAAFRTEFLIKTGLVLLGASINLSIILSAAGPAIAQSVFMITVVFLFTWWIAGVLGLEPKLRALLAAGLAICGVSAAIAAAGAVHAKKEQLAYVAGLVILFAIPSIFIQPWLVGLLGLPSAVAGAWIGGNIDTTAAVTAAGTLVGEDALKIATIVKVTQNAMMGVVAVLLTIYFVMRVDRTPDSPRPGLGELWVRFPKFVLGFIAASIIGTWFVGAVAADTGTAAIGAINGMRTWFLILAFVSIGLELRVTSLREAGWRPIGVFAIATVFNLALALVVASILFAGFSVS
ncbi:MAG: putative sulfate exporter family transporter [Chloroflexi bacterium]|nr:putative sulfate exporter family transporter [Chloroflexota bacterium]